MFRFYNFVNSFWCQKDNCVQEREHKLHARNNNCCCAGSSVVCTDPSSCGGCVEETQEATWERYIRLATFSANINLLCTAKLFLTGWPKITVVRGRPEWTTKKKLPKESKQKHSYQDYSHQGGSSNRKLILARQPKITPNSNIPVLITTTFWKWS